MSLWSGNFLPLAVLIWPLLLGMLAAWPPLRIRAVRLLPLAPLPALFLALAGSEGVTTAPDLLLGVTLALDPGARLLLGMSALLWTVAGLAAQRMAGQPRTGVFSGFWCLTLAGNLAVFMAQDVITFYVAFAAVSLAAWFLIVHDRTEKAHAAGRVYIIMALAGEVCLLLGLMLGAHAADSMGIAEVRAALAGGGGVAVALLILGFGVKAGMVPLHVWLPLAHPAAPVPASAVLSGAIVKAGLVGFLVLIPAGMFGNVLMILGLAGAFGAALWGLTQANPKAVLAYSTISQMGLMVMLVGAGGSARDLAPYFALHHGLAKGALFLLVGVMLAARTGRQRWLCLGLAGLVAASVAGAPLTGGALAKAAVKPALSETVTLLLSLSSVTTTLILMWFLSRLWQSPAPERATPGFAAAWSLPALLAVFTLAAPWWLWPEWSGQSRLYPLAAQALIDALWPVALGLLLALFLRLWPLRAQPPGDLLALGAGWSLRWPAMPEIWLPRGGGEWLSRFQALAKRAETGLRPWSVSGALMPVMVLILFALLVWPS